MHLWQGKCHERMLGYLCVLPTAIALHFSPFELPEHYRCGNFLKEEINDRVLEFFYSTINAFIRILSRPFPHQDLLNKRALEGDTEEIKQSFLKRYPKWIEFEQWWLILASMLILISFIFSLGYVVYSCCICVHKAGKKSCRTEKKHDKCKRRLLNCIIATLVVMNIFFVSALLISSQYAEYGADQLPQRLGYCVDDLSLYRKETDTWIRKLLIDDFQSLNDSITTKLANGGYSMVKYIKKTTGAVVIDVLANITDDSTEAQTYIANVQKDVTTANIELNKFRLEFSKLQKISRKELLNCVRNEINSVRNLCQRAEKILADFGHFPFVFQQDVINEATISLLQQISKMNISSIIEDSMMEFEDLATRLQSEIDRKKISIQNKLKRIADDLFHTAEAISSQIHQMKFDFLYKFLGSQFEQKPYYKNYTKYCWYASLLICAIFALVALYFLFALCYGCCGRRPTERKEDCCVKSTGSKLFTCGVWITVLLYSFLMVLSVCLLFIGANLYHLVCQPIENPLSRPDMLSLSERLVEVWKEKQLENNLSPLLGNRSVADLIRACERNETLYQIYELDKKFHLFNIREIERETYEQFRDNIKLSNAELTVSFSPNVLVSPERLDLLRKFNTSRLLVVPPSFFDMIERQLKEFDIGSQAAILINEMEESGLSRSSVENLLNQLKMIESSSVSPLKYRLKTILSNISLLNERLSNISLPMSNLFTKLQHAEALLTSNPSEYLKNAADAMSNDLGKDVEDYIEYVRKSMSTDVSSCFRLKYIIRGVRAAFCSSTLNPSNGIWASMLLSLLCSLFITIFATPAIRLYNKFHPYPKYVVQETQIDTQLSAFATDAYTIRTNPAVFSGNYCNYSAFTGQPPPYMRKRN